MHKINAEDKAENTNSIETESDDSNNSDPQVDPPIRLDQMPDIYGPFYERHQAYNTSYSTGYPEPEIVTGSCSDTSYGVDSANTIMAQRRARDKKCSDGWACRDANYYKYHYGNELADAERKRWWGNLEH